MLFIGSAKLLISIEIRFGLSVLITNEVKLYVLGCES